MEKGFLYIIFKAVLDKLKYLNLVELFKYIAVKTNPQKEKALSRFGTDIFILVKWLFVFVIWFSGASNCLITIFVWYLIATNIYTYFIYHIWNDEALDTSALDNDSIRRRFLNLMLAVAFSDFAFAYLYRIPYMAEFSWTSAANISGNSLWYSISNSLAANYDIVSPLSELGYSISMGQLILTFIFVTIIISRSIPQKN